jgi:hypothetical protein
VFCTNVVLLDGVINKFLISRGIDLNLRPIEDSPCYIIPPKGDDPTISTNYTHYIVQPGMENGREARIQFILKNGEWVDPYDLNPFGPHSSKLRPNFGNTDSYAFSHLTSTLSVRHSWCRVHVQKKWYRLHSSR